MPKSKSVGCRILSFNLHHTHTQQLITMASSNENDTIDSGPIRAFRQINTSTEYVGIDDTKDGDCLFGKGNKNRLHIGNLAFRALIRSRVDAYDSCDSRGEKSRVVVDTLKNIEDSGGRLLQLQFNEKLEQICWVRLDRHLARDIVGDSIRDVLKVRRRARYDDWPKNELDSLITEKTSFTYIIDILKHGNNKPAEAKKKKSVKKRKKQRQGSSLSNVETLRTETTQPTLDPAFEVSLTSKVIPSHNGPAQAKATGVTKTRLGPEERATKAAVSISAQNSGFNTLSLHEATTLKKHTKQAQASSLSNHKTLSKKAAKATMNPGIPVSIKSKSIPSKKVPLQINAASMNRAASDKSTKLTEEEALQVEPSKISRKGEDIGGSSSKPTAQASLRRYNPSSEAIAARKEARLKKQQREQRKRQHQQLDDLPSVLSGQPGTRDHTLKVLQSSRHKKPRYNQHLGGDADLAQSASLQDLYVLPSSTRSRLDGTLVHNVPNHAYLDEAQFAACSLALQQQIRGTEEMIEAQEMHQNAVLRRLLSSQQELRPQLLAPPQTVEEHTICDSATRLAAALEMQRIAGQEVEYESRILSQAPSRSPRVSIHEYGTAEEDIRNDIMLLRHQHEQSIQATSAARRLSNQVVLPAGLAHQHHMLQEEAQKSIMLTNGKGATEDLLRLQLTARAGRNPTTQQRALLGASESDIEDILTTMQVRNREKIAQILLNEQQEQYAVEEMLTAERTHNALVGSFAHQQASLLGLDGAGASSSRIFNGLTMGIGRNDITTSLLLQQEQDMMLRQSQEVGGILAPGSTKLRAVDSILYDHSSASLLELMDPGMVPSSSVGIMRPSQNEVVAAALATRRGDMMGRGAY